jgi:hypothetical protein
MNWYYPGYYNPYSPYVPYVPESPIAATFLEGGLPYGASYLYPDAPHVLLHVLDADTFDDSQAYNPAPTFNMLYVPITYTGAALLKRLGGDKKKGYIQEVYEQGGGWWIKGTKVEGGSDAAKKELEEYGWKRGAGAGAQPVWVVVKGG